MSAEIKFSGNDTKVRINSVDPPREVNITGAGAVITNNPNSYDIVIGGTGTITGVANVGTGTGTIYRDTVAGIINIKSLAVGSSKLALTNNANDITVDVTEANLNIANQTGSIGNARISDLAYSKLTGTPTYAIDTIGSGTDITTNNVSITKHGLVPKAPNIVTQFLDGTGVFSTPAGEANTYSSSSIGGVPIILTKNVFDLPFKGIKAGSSLVTITDDPTNKNVNVDLDTTVLTTTNTKILTNKTIDSVTNTVSNIGTYKYSIFRSGANTVCRNNLTGLIESTNTVPETVFQYALDNSLRSAIFVQNGSYQFSGGFTGLTFSQNETWLVAEPGALITVPAGFTGKLFTFTENTEGCHLIGGRYSENTTISRLWTFAYIAAVEGSQTLITIRDVYVRFVGKVIELRVTGTAGWINGNRFEDIFADQFLQGIVFSQVSAQSGTNGINRNNFSNVILQSYSGTTDGIINVAGISNYFDDCKVWDMPVAQNGVTISANATDTIFFGGIIKATNGFVDNGVRTKIIENSNIILPSATLVSPTITTPIFSAPLTKAQQHAATIYNDQANNFGASNQNFRSGTLNLFNPANTFLYQFAGSALTGNVTITLPLLASSDTMAVLAFAQTLTNKTYNMSNNTLTDTSTALGDIPKSDGTKFTRLARGSANTILGVNSGGTDIAYATLVDANVSASAAIAHSKVGTNLILSETGLTGVRTKTYSDRTGKMLDDGGPNLLGANFLQFTKMSAPAAAASNSLNVYVDTADTHLKYLDSQSSVIDITSMLGPIRGKRTGRYDSGSSTAGSGIFAGGFTAVGTNSGLISDSTNGYSVRFTTGAVAGNAAGHKYANAYTYRAFNPYLGVRFKLGTATNNRVYIGWNNGVDPGANSEDPLAGVNGVMLVQRSTDTVFQISTNNNTTSTFASTGVTVDNTTVYTIEFRGDAANNKFQWSLNGSAWADLTTTIPAATTVMAYQAEIQTNEAVAHTVNIYAVETWSDK